MPLNLGRNTLANKEIVGKFTVYHVKHDKQDNILMHDLNNKKQLKCYLFVLRLTIFQVSS